MITGIPDPFFPIPKVTYQKFYLPLDPNVSDKKFVCKEVFWWDGFEIIPPRPKLGLLSNFTNRCDFSQDTEESSGEYSEEESTTTGSSDTEGSAESDPKPRLKPVKRKPKRKLETSVWQPNISARSNQDIQRAYEEKTIREITEFLNRNIIIDTLTKGRGVSKNSTPVGGIWVRLEQEWKETSQKNKTPALTLPGKNRFARGK